MKKESIKIFNEINDQVDKEIENNYKNVTLEKLIDLYTPIMVNDYFKKHDMSLIDIKKEKTNILVEQISNLIYDRTVYEEKIEKNNSRANNLWNYAWIILLIFLITSHFHLFTTSILLAVLSPLYLSLSLVHNIISRIYNNKYVKNNLQIQYVRNLLIGATIEMHYSENKQITDINNLSQSLEGEEYSIKYEFNNNDLNIEVYDQENKEMVSSYQLTRHK